MNLILTIATLAIQLIPSLIDTTRLERSMAGAAPETSPVEELLSSLDLLLRIDNLGANRTLVAIHYGRIYLVAHISFGLWCRHYFLVKAGLFGFELVVLVLP